MRLILSGISNINSVVDKDHLLLLVNTENKNVDWLNLNVKDSHNFIGTKGLVYSGDLLISSVFCNKKDKLLIVNVVNGKCVLTDCIKSKNINSLVSVYKGRIYVASTGTNSMNQIVINEITNNIIRDVFHYKFDFDIYITSLINWNKQWFASGFGEGWRDNNFENGFIIELTSNNRKVYSNIVKPNSLFFNRNDEVCFCESGRGLFHFGQNIIYVGGYPRGVIEDRKENGYWIGISSDEYFNTISKLIFLTYDGYISKTMYLPHIYYIYSIIEAEGFIAKLI